ncbi:hypothetical protein [Flavobacterium foetidum]|uniref:hypothetical protein n=1 Tax=Flavobacterium foetidum TaxID=2026681 RepID=UPI001075406D|nr:hypothetical protein [Flavobacterium foetidum]KAF2514163.1 hypothetical protein E0W73_12195 [Flavobacterium foetidum]
MKKTVIVLSAVCLSAFLYVSCSNNDDIINQFDTTSVSASVVIDALTDLDIKNALTITNTNPAAKPAETPVTNCANITVESPSGTEYPKVYTVDYGTGCTLNNIARKGKLKITLTGPVIATGSKMTIERINYSLNNFLLEGTIEYTNTTATATVPQWTRKVTNGKLTDILGRTFTNSGTCTVKQTAGVDTPYVLEDNVYEMTEGNHTVTSGTGGTVTLTIQETLIKKYSCEYVSQGKLKIQNTFLNGVVDYGNNTCDNKYTYTHENGTTYTLSM